MSDETWLLSMLFGIFVLCPVGYCVVSWLSGNRNTPAGGGGEGDKTLRAEYPGQPMAVPAAEIVNQRLVGRNRGGDIDVYVADYTGTEAAKSGMHHHQRSLDWMREGGRAESVGVHLHIVSEYEMDRIGAGGNGDRHSAWINPPSEGFDPETGVIDGAIKTERTGGGVMQALALALAIIVVIVIGGGGIVSWFIVLSR